MRCYRHEDITRLAEIANAGSGWSHEWHWERDGSELSRVGVEAALEQIIRVRDGAFDLIARAQPLIAELTVALAEDDRDR